MLVNAEFVTSELIVHARCVPMVLVRHQWVEDDRLVELLQSLFRLPGVGECVSKIGKQVGVLRALVLGFVKAVDAPLERARIERGGAELVMAARILRVNGDCALGKRNAPTQRSAIAARQQQPFKLECPREPAVRRRIARSSIGTLA